jgi:hypothetical protein
MTGLHVDMITLSACEWKWSGLWYTSFLRFRVILDIIVTCWPEVVRLCQIHTLMCAHGEAAMEQCQPIIVTLGLQWRLT